MPREGLPPSPSPPFFTRQAPIRKCGSGSMCMNEIALWRRSLCPQCVFSSSTYGPTY